eukprot:TRINITY_DN9151_c0_g4_i1.p1 TRINITY_DN9151_c0_g4~~TRINITY_DN9151_c0_g4_i1.p1  ORF type:complete len:284 (+),score=23.72 TRINITY_DN9151_c0_g4_i1:3-854(+)
MKKFSEFKNCRWSKVPRLSPEVFSRRTRESVGEDHVSSTFLGLKFQIATPEQIVGELYNYLRPFVVSVKGQSRHVQSTRMLVFKPAEVFIKRRLFEKRKIDVIAIQRNFGQIKFEGIVQEEDASALNWLCSDLTAMADVRGLRAEDVLGGVLMRNQAGCFSLSIEVDQNLQKLHDKYDASPTSTVLQKIFETRRQLRTYSKSLQILSKTHENFNFHLFFHLLCNHRAKTIRTILTRMKRWSGNRLPESWPLERMKCSRKDLKYLYPSVLSPQLGVTCTLFMGK